MIGEDVVEGLTTVINDLLDGDADGATDALL